MVLYLCNASVLYEKPYLEKKKAYWNPIATLWIILKFYLHFCSTDSPLKNFIEINLAFSEMDYAEW